MDSQAEDEEEKDGNYYDDLLLTNPAEVEIHESKDEIKVEPCLEDNFDSPSSSYLSLPVGPGDIVIKQEPEYSYDLDATKLSNGEADTREFRNRTHLRPPPWTRDYHMTPEDDEGCEMKKVKSSKIRENCDISERPIVLRVNDEPELRRLSVYEGSFFRCLLCSYRTAKKDRIRRHVLGKHSDLKPHSCPLCGYSAVEAGTVQRHMRTVHAKEKRYKCPFCEHRSAEAVNLKHHVKAIHEKDKQFKCDLCDYRAVQERWLKHHKRIKHSGERLFPCPFCEHSAAQLAHLKTHMAAKHTGEKTNTCPYCPYRSVQASVMKRHIRNKHSAET